MEEIGPIFSIENALLINIEIFVMLHIKDTYCEHLSLSRFQHENFLIPKENVKDDGATWGADKSVLNSGEKEEIEKKGVISRLKKRTILLERIVDDFDKRSPFVRICFLDCCRKSLVNDIHLTKMTTKGDVAEIVGIHNGQPSDLVSFITAFACTPGAIADDNKNDDNGLFTKYLLKNLVRPKIGIMNVLDIVTVEVVDASKSLQRPIVNHSLLTLEAIFLCEQYAGKLKLIIKSVAEVD